MQVTRLFQADGDPDGPPGAWRVDLPDGGSVRWEGFYVGPLELTQAQIADAAQALLGLPLDAVPPAAEAALRPSTHDDGTGPCVVIHSATPVLRNLQGDLDEVIRGRHADDTATYMETRSVCLARPGDLVVGRTVPWRTATEVTGIEGITLPGIDYYYLSQALLELMVSSGGQAPQVRRLVSYLRERPDAVIRLYSLDIELQIALLYLMREAGLSQLSTDANSPEVARYWNTKAPLYPLVADVSGITSGSAEEMLAAETEHAPLRRRLGLSYERLPGYAFPADPGEVVRAARLLRSRYRLTTGCLKPSKGGGGLRIMPGLDLTDEENLQNLLKPYLGTQELLILEAQVDYARLTIGGRSVPFAPSAHVRYGRLAEGLTLQLTSGSQWQGNIYVDREACYSLGVPEQTYHSMRDTVSALRESLAAQGLQLVTGGVDFAIGTVGGAFGSRLFVALQDPNLSSHGAEYLRRLVNYLASVGGPRYAATKVIMPTAAGDLPAILSVAHPSLNPGTRFQAICSVPGRWGLVAAGADSPHLAVQEVLAFERDLAGHGLVSGS